MRARALLVAAALLAPAGRRACALEGPGGEGRALSEKEVLLWLRGLNRLRKKAEEDESALEGKGALLRRPLARRCREFASKHLERDEDGDLTEVGSAALLVLAEMKDLSTVSGQPEFERIVAGFTARNCRDRDEHFRRLLEGTPLERALLRPCLEGLSGDVPTSVRLSAGSARPGDELGYRYATEPTGPVWLPASPPRAEARFAALQTTCELVADGRRRAALRGGGARRVERGNPLVSHRVFMPGDAALSGGGSYRPTETGIVAVGWFGKPPDARQSFFASALPDGEREAWHVELGRPERSRAVVPVLPPEDAQGAPRGGLSMKVVGLDPEPWDLAPAAIRGEWGRAHRRYSWAVRDHSAWGAGDHGAAADGESRLAYLEIEIRAGDGGPHSLVRSAHDGELPDTGFWALILDRHGALVDWTEADLPTRWPVAGSSTVTLNANRRSCRGRCLVTLPAEPGAYTAVVGFGRFRLSEDDPPPDHFWHGELVAEPMEFEVSADGPARLRW